MTWRGLLVSVRNVDEAAAAVAGGAAIVDIKEPDRGPLGAARPETIASIAAVVGHRRPWTMACGELVAEGGPDAAASDDGCRRIADLLAQVWAALPPAAPWPAAVKVGLAGAAGRDWQRPLESLYRALPPSVAGVAVAYADWRRAGAPVPTEVIAAAARIGCRVLLLDTFDKTADGLCGCVTHREVAGWVADAHAAGLGVAVAGRLALGEIPWAWSLGADVVALRSAVCFNGRSGSVEADLVRAAVGMCGSRTSAGGVGTFPSGAAGVIG
jgi:uncharacterized protein (UPF0264 family)